MARTSDFCFAHRDLFLVPAEELTPDGIRAPFAEELVGRGGVSKGWLERFDAAFALYWRRAEELALRAPRHGLPPRAQNLCIALDSERVRPFFQPLGRASCLLERSDFEPETSSLEYAAYQFVYVERLNLLQQVVPALVQDLGYWLLRTSRELDDFRAGCRRARGGHAPGWRALARALEWIPRCFHQTLKPPPGEPSEPMVPVGGTGFLLPSRYRSELEKLERRWREAAELRTGAYFKAHSARREEDPERLVAWLQDEKPLLLVTGKQGEILWDPDAPQDTGRLRTELAEVTTAAARSLREDWGVVGARSRAVLDSLMSPSELPAPGKEIDQNGLAYIHRERRLVAVNLHEPGMQRLREPAVPFERWMLAARTVHEWGHLMVEAGYVPVPEGRAGDFEQARGQLAELFQGIARDAPPALRAHAARQIALLSQRGSLGQALVAQCLARMSDWQSNLLAQRYLTPEESETYVRNNLRPLLQELDSTQLFQALARYAFEYQYLTFDEERDARGYLLACTWFGEQFLRRNVLSEQKLEALLLGVGRLCHCHEVDERHFRA